MASTGRGAASGATGEPAESPAASHREPQPAVSTPDDQHAASSKTTEVKKINKPADPNVKYEVVTVKLPDGTLKKFRRPVKPKTTDGNTTGSTVAAAAHSGAEPNAKIGKSDVKPVAAAAAAAEGIQTTGDGQGSKTPEKMATDNGAARDNAVKDAANSGPANAAPAAAETKGASSADKAAALEEQDLYFKHRRRQAFKRALLGGAARILATDIADASEIVAEDETISDMDSYLDDSDIDDTDDGSDGQHESEAVDAQRKDEGEGQTTAVAHDGIHRINGAIGNASAAALSTAPRRRELTVDEKKGDGKDTYRFTQKDLNALDAAAAANAKKLPLNHRWSAFSFYLMASLSVVLPLLFVVLSIFIFQMDRKPLYVYNGSQGVTTSWNSMPDVIKAAITLWPIVFAAVVAQAFKTWATHRVERGVTLGELEQLVGANSFAAAAKQPFLLRRLDLLTLAVFLSWCFSPLGSQMMQRVYTVQRDVASNNVSVTYLPAMGPNRLFGPGAEQNLGSDALYGDYLQTATTYYVGSLTASSPDQNAGGGKGGIYQDSYGHPLPWSTYGFSQNTAGYGIPVGLPQSVVAIADPPGVTVSSTQLPYENVVFSATTSFFQLTCSNWTTMTYQSLAALNGSSFIEFSPSYTLGLSFVTPEDSSSPIAGVNYATMVDTNYLSQKQKSGQLPPADTSYLFITCGLSQTFINISISCTVNIDEKADGTVSGNFNWNCMVSGTEPIVPADQVDPSWKTVLAEPFAEYIAGSSPDNLYSPTTPTERFANAGQFITGISSSPLNASYILQNTPPAVFESNFGQLLNTWIGIGYCPECVSTANLTCLMNNADGSGPCQAVNMAPEERNLTRTVQAAHTYTQNLIFSVDKRFAGVTLASSVFLLLIGIVSVLVESVLVAPDTLGYVSSAARNSRYLHLPKQKVGGAMSGASRARALRDIEVMMQDVKSDNPEAGKIALGMKTDKAVRLRNGRVYR